jgi:HEPN domain-containing protein
MTNLDLAASYLKKATVRLEVLDLLLDRGAYSDVVREAQEAVELATKAMLRRAGIDPPKWHDVSGIILENRERFPGIASEHFSRLADVSKALRRDRELSFYGDIDFIPSEEYSRADADSAIEAARFVVEIAAGVVKG